MSVAPRKLEKPDFSKLIEHLEGGIESAIQNDGYPGKDFAHYTFEAAMEAVYGPNVWDWWNDHAETT